MKKFIFYLLATLLSTFGFAQGYDSCRTYTYAQQIGNNSGQQYISRSKTISDHSLISVGFTAELNSSAKDGLIFKQDKTGKLVWQKRYGVPAFDEEFTSFKETYYGELVVSGVATNIATQQRLMQFSKLANDGSLLWQKNFSGFPTGTNINNCKIAIAEKKDYFFAAQTDSSVIYGMLSSQGDMMWQRSFKTTPGTRLVNISSEADQLLILTNSMDSGYHVVKQYYVNFYWFGSKDIKYTRKYGGQAQQSSYILHDMEIHGQYTYFSGIRSVNNQPYELIRLNVNQGYIIEALESISTPGVVLDITAGSTISGLGECMAFTEKRKSKDVNLIKVSGSYNSFSHIYWSEKTTWQDSVILKGCNKTWDAGYMVYGAAEKPGRKNVVQLKVDSAGMVPGCISKMPADFGIRRVLAPDDVVDYQYLTDSLLPVTATSSVSAMLIDSIFFCKERKCPAPLPYDTCNSSFYNIYTAYNTTNIPTSLKTIKHSLYLAGNAYGTDYAFNHNSSFISKIDTNGHLIAQRKFKLGLSDYANITTTNDDALLLYGNVYTEQQRNAGYFAKIDTNLITKWAYSFETDVTTSQKSDLNYAESLQAPDNSYFLAYTNGYNIWDDKHILLIKTDANGSFVWSKIYRPNWSEINHVGVNKILYKNGYIYLLATNGYNNYNATFILKIDAASGSLIWSKRYLNSKDHLRLTSIQFYNNELFLYGSNYDGLGYNNVLVKMDIDGNVIASTSFGIPSANVSPVGEALLNNDGKIRIVGSFYATYPFLNPKDFNITLGPDFTLLSAKQRQGPKAKSIRAMTASADGHFYEAGYANTLFYDPYINYFPYLVKYSEDGNVGLCPSDTLITNFSSVSISATSNYFTQKDTTLLFIIPDNSSEQFFLAEQKQICASVNGCNSLNITGGNNVCSPEDMFSFVAQKNLGCKAPVEWTIDQSGAQLIYSDDSIITLKFLAAGDYTLKATIFGDCVSHTATKILHIFMPRPVLDLGPDKILCNSSNFILNAHRGFKTYLWQDGTTDSLFTVTSPGLYHVTVTDSCNNILRDTIDITYSVLSPALDLGPDRFLCSNTQILLNARKGFTSYLWQDGSVDSLFSVTAPGLYHVTVTDGCSNTFRDTVAVSNYRKAILLDLGVDTILCNGKSMLLNARRGYVTYQWQDNSQDSMFLATVAGKYWVKVTDHCGNAYTDTIKILPDVYQQFDLGPDKIKCNSDTLIVEINAGFNNYIWTSNSTQFTPVTPTSIKIYPSGNAAFYLTASKQNGCILHDTVRITVKYSLPIDLGNTDRFCINDSLKLNADMGFVKYLWSGGQTTPSIFVHTAGTYFVTGTDGDFCKSSDTINIKMPYPLPNINLRGDSILCQGQEKIINAGADFTFYNWSTGAHTPTISVNSLGKYWVNVLNSNGCKASDTAWIKSLKRLPSDFLSFSDSSLCNYDTISLKSLTNYQSYLWNTGARSQSIIINKPGLYWLKVTDKAGCIGLDSAYLSTKPCVRQLFFPNSFTPNRDSKNDIYVPVAFGFLSYYHFCIYNRSGRKIFESYEVMKGWDGNYLGAQQEQGAYIWTATYSFPGEKIVNRTGTILLLR